MNRSVIHRAIFAGFLSLLLIGSTTALALDAVPQYEVVPIGTMIRNAYPGAGISAAVSVNQQGDTVGYALIDSQYRSFIYTTERGLQMLPGLAGWSSNLAVDVNDRDVTGRVLIVGRAQGSIYTDPNAGVQTAVLWLYNTATGGVERIIDIGILPGFNSSSATAVSNDGLVIGSSRTSSFLNPSSAMVYDFSTGILHALDAPFTPADINNNWQITGGSYRARLVQDSATGAFRVTEVEDLGSPAGTLWATNSAINDRGWMAGVTTMTFSDGAGRRVKGATRYTDAWKVLWAISAFDFASDLNVHGDVVGMLGINASM